MNEKAISKIKKLKDKYNELDEKIRLAKEEQKEISRKISEIENEEKLNLIRKLSSDDLEKALKLHEITEKSGMTIEEVADFLTTEENKIESKIKE